MAEARRRRDGHSYDARDGNAEDFFVNGGVIGGIGDHSGAAHPAQCAGVEHAALHRELQQEQAQKENASSVPDSVGKRKRIDSLLDQMREGSSSRMPSSSGETASRRGSKETADAYTTNLSIGNLSPSAEEGLLKTTFGAFGPIASVKIMWPRGDDALTRRPLRAFVAFMSRRSAEDAMREMHGRTLLGMEITIDWGKAITLPQQPVWPPPEGEDEPIQLTIPKPANAKPTPAAPPMEEPHPRLPDVKVEPPSDRRKREEIDTLAAYIAQDGVALEEAIKEREGDNSRFAFFFDDASPEHVYFRWRVFSYAQGDSDNKWRIEPFQMCVNGARWFPPDLPGKGEEASGHTLGERASVVAGAPRADKRLTQEEAYAWQAVLRNMCAERDRIAEAMLFAISKPESAQEIVGMLAHSIITEEASASSKLGRLLVTSDILCNAGTSARKARAYNVLLQGYMPQIMASLNNSLLRCEGRITMESFRRRIMAVLSVWSDRMIFNEEFLVGIEVTFLRGAHPALGTHLSAEATTRLRQELGTRSDHQLAMQCKHNGLDSRGSRQRLIARILLHEDRKVERQLPTALSQE